MTIDQESNKSEGDKILSGLLGSETRAKILKILILNKEKSFRLSELTKKTKMDISGVHREISNLVSLNILKANKQTKKPEYRINKNQALFNGLLELFKKADSLSKKYFLFEEMPAGYPAVVADFMNVNVTNNYLKSKRINSRLSKTLSIYEYPKLEFFFYYKEFNKISKEVLEKLTNNPHFGTEDIEEAIKLSKKLSELADEIEEQNYAKFSNKEILRLLKKYHETYEEVHRRGWIANSSDMPDMLFTKHLLFILEEKIRKKGSLINGKNAFSKLTTPTEDSFIQVEYKQLLEILVEINSDKETKNIFKNLEPRHILTEIRGKFIGNKIEKHAHDYGWVGYGIIGPNWDETYFIGILSSLIKQNKDPKKLKEEIKRDRENLIKEQEKITKSIELDKNEQALFEVARGFVFTKGLRKDSMFKFFSRMELFYKEISRRLHVSLTDIRFCFPHEFDQLFSQDPKFIKTLHERQKFSICESSGPYESDLYLNGQAAKNYLEKLPFEEEESTQVSGLDGTCACPGRIRGKVKIINTPDQMEKMEKGDILVSIATSPDLVIAMKKAGAIVTDMGGITSHAAIVSRELNIPCVVGTKIATKALKDNMLVDVDATHGTAKILEDKK